MDITITGAFGMNGEESSTIIPEGKGKKIMLKKVWRDMKREIENKDENMA